MIFMIVAGYYRPVITLGVKHQSRGHLFRHSSQPALDLCKKLHISSSCILKLLYEMLLILCYKENRASIFRGFYIFLPKFHSQNLISHLT